MKIVVKIMCVVLIAAVFCGCLTACGNASWHNSVGCNNMRWDLSFSANVRAKYGSTDPSHTYFDCKESVLGLAEIIRRDNPELVVEVVGDAIYLSGKAEADAEYIKPSIAVIRTGEDEYLQTNMTFVSHLYLDYRLLDSYEGILDELDNKPMKLADALDEADVLGKYLKWGYALVEELENGFIIKDAKGMKEAPFKYSEPYDGEFSFTFEQRQDGTYMTVAKN